MVSPERVAGWDSMGCGSPGRRCRARSRRAAVRCDNRDGVDGGEGEAHGGGEAHTLPAARCAVSRHVPAMPNPLDAR